jgi:DNA-binding MarR family transcriptional regulator
VVLTREQRFFTAILRAAEASKRYFSTLVEPEGLSLSQFNVLRILQDAGPDGLPTLGIRDRMVERAPAITRLVDRLVEWGLVERQRDPEDRRIVHCRLTVDGEAVLARLDPVLIPATAELLSPFAPDTLTDTVETLRELVGTIDPEASEF